MGLHVKHSVILGRY